MPEHDTKHTSSTPTKQYSHDEIVAGVKKIISQKFTTRDLTDLQSWIRGQLQVATRRDSK